jgi:hypothetical protein
VSSGEYTLAELKVLSNRQNMLEQDLRIIGDNKYRGTFTNGYASGFGYFEYTNGNKAWGYEKNDMMFPFQS